MESFFATSQIPSATNPSGRNTGGISDPQIDGWLTQASTTLDPAARKDLYCKISDRVQNTLYAQEYTSTWTNWPISQPKLKGWEQYEKYSWFGAGSENWYLAP
jgi:ABC-type transport system substrate-binding protein